MSRFFSAKHLASWAGVCPGHHESVGRTKNTKVRPGNPYLKGAPGIAAFGAARTNNTYLQARYKRLTATDNVPYSEFDGTHFTQPDPERATRGAISALNHLGYTVTLNPMEGAA